MAAETDPHPPTAPVFDLVRRAQQGDRSALPGLRKLLDADPDLWRHYGDLAGHAKTAWLDLLAGPDLALREAAERKVADLDVVLRAIGYFHGPLLLDAAIRACTTGWRVPDRLDGLTAAELNDLLGLLDAKYFVKLTTTPFTQPERLLPLAQLRADLRGLIAEQEAVPGSVGMAVDPSEDWATRATAWCLAAQVAAA